MGEWATGAYVAVGALAAWLSARRTGEGQHVDLSMFESIVERGIIGDRPAFDI